VRSRSERRRGVRACPRVPTCKRAPGRWRVSACVAAALAVLLAQSALAASTPEASPSDAQIEAAVSTLKDDPNLFSKRKIRTLHWASHSADRPTPIQRPGWLEWINELFEWLTETARVLVWAVCAVLVGILVVFLIRMLRDRRDERVAAGFVAPTHVHDLDIRPESLPDDVGAASLDLWRNGEHRMALALLYRACLSRLAHVHAVPVRDSTTEGECVLLAAGHLRPGSAAYVSQLVRTWQRAVYRGEDPTAEVVTSLCGGFGAALDTPPRGQPAELAA
jgi:hypothetical protein